MVEHPVYTHDPGSECNRLLTTVRMFSFREAVSQPVGYQKNTLLDFRLHVAHVPAASSAQHCFCDCSARRVVDSPQSAERNRADCLRSGLVDHLDGKILGPRLGNRCKPDGNNDLSLADLISCADSVASPFGSACDWSDRDGCVLTMQLRAAAQ